MENFDFSMINDMVFDPEGLQSELEKEVENRIDRFRRQIESMASAVKSFINRIWS